jgi:hypothetical protein
MTHRDVPDIARDVTSLFLLCVTGVLVALLLFAITEGIIQL